MRALLAGRKRQGGAVYGLAAALVIARSFVWICFEQSHFDSDQAVMGLMAKHLAEGRAFPLFFYGQHYMLAVEAWLAAPVFRMFGPSVATLKLVPLAFNLAAAWLLLWLLTRRAGLRGSEALLASVFFLLPPPIPSSRLVEAAGGNIEPFFYVLLLWWLRDRPITFGLVAGVAVLNREFTVYGIASILLIDAAAGALFTKQGMKTWVLRLGSMVPAIVALNLLQPYAALKGPETMGMLVKDGTPPICWNIAQLPANLRWLATENLANLFGWKVEQLGTYVQSSLTIGQPLVLVPLVGALVIAVAAGLRGRRHANREARSLAAYLVLVGTLTVAAYVLFGCTVRDGMLIRYTLLALYLPIGIVTIFLSVPSSGAVRGIVAGGVCLWAIAGAADHARLIAEYARRPPPDSMRELTNYLESNGVRYGYAPYWTAYAVDFLSGERVVLASSEFSRIEDYDRLSRAHDDQAIRILFDAPCPNGVVFRRWCLLYLDHARRRQPTSP